jgi:hypothetical protein
VGALEGPALGAAHGFSVATSLGHSGIVPARTVNDESWQNELASEFCLAPIAVPCVSKYIVTPPKAPGCAVMSKTPRQWSMEGSNPGITEPQDFRICATTSA